MRRGERRASASPIGTHPERRLLLPRRREALSRAGARPRGAAVVLPPVVNLFEKPDTASPVVSQAALGTSVTLLGSRREWALVETPDRYRGWARSAALRPLPERRPRYPDPDRGVEIANLLANVYREPDVTSACPIAVAPLLARMEALKEAGEWARIRLPDGRVGWVQRGDIRRVGPEAASGAAGDAVPEGIAATALRFLGLPYLWGGRTPFGLDCSGLAQLVFQVHGCLLPRDADLQDADPRLVLVPRPRIRAGDLVFFGPDPASITHVGIALGGAEFVSATTYRSPTVRVDSLDDPYWAKLFRVARRLKD
jgi:gamma-D-glutamyl-L-lysine dipeptidyl-peptidase